MTSLHDQILSTSHLKFIFFPFFLCWLVPDGATFRVFDRRHLICRTNICQVSIPRCSLEDDAKCYENGKFADRKTMSLRMTSKAAKIIKANSILQLLI